MSDRNICHWLALAALLAGAGAAKAEVPDGYFQLQSAYLEQQNKCLEGNRVVPDATIAGAAFMADCGNFSGQLWKATSLDNGYYRLTTMYREADNECFEGSRPFMEGDGLKGAARMDPCGNYSGQMWKFIALDNGYYRLTNMWLEPENRCLESSRLDTPDDPLRGAARMDPCGNFSGQMWKLVPHGQAARRAPPPAAGASGGGSSGARRN